MTVYLFFLADIIFSFTDKIHKMLQEEGMNFSHASAILKMLTD